MLVYEATPEAGKRSGNYEMKGFISVTDNDCFQFLSGASAQQQLSISRGRFLNI